MPHIRTLGDCLLRRQSPGLRLVVSYADAGQGHVGTIYQAGGWLYLGTSEQSYLRIGGKVVHLHRRRAGGGPRLLPSDPS